MNKNLLNALGIVGLIYLTILSVSATFWFIQDLILGY